MLNLILMLNRMLILIIKVLNLESFGGNINVKVDLYNYAKKIGFKKCKRS